MAIVIVAGLEIWIGQGTGIAREQLVNGRAYRSCLRGTCEVGVVCRHGSEVALVASPSAVSCKEEVIAAAAYKAAR